MAIIKGRLGAVYIAQYKAGSTGFTKEVMTANVAKTVFTIDAAAKRFWDPEVPVTVYYNDSALTPATLGVPQYPGGVVTWASTPGDEAVTVSGSFLTIVQVGECKSWSMDVGYDFVDTTALGDSFREQTAIMRNSTVSIDAFYVDDTIFTEMVSGNDLIGFDLFMDATGAAELRFTGYGTIASESVTTAVDGIVEGPFTINVSDGPYYVAGLA